MHKREQDMKSDFQLALITGATSGIGEGLANFYAAKNVPLVLVGRSSDKLKQLKKKLGAEIIACDLSNSSERDRLLAFIKTRCPDLVVNAAGFGHYLEALSHPVEEHLKMIEVNASSLAAITLTAAEALKKQNREGTILNISSAAAFQVFPFFSTYSATKAFVNQFSESLYYELLPYGIKVLTSCPGMVQTAFRENAGGGPGKKSMQMQMSVDYAVKRLQRQITSAKRLDVFDLRYKIAITLAQWIPKALAASLIKQIMKKQFS